ncbi:MAG: adenosine deaminase [Bryobacteraceae bacterium]
MSILQELPKAELHLHLEGAIEPETVVLLAPECTVEEVRARYRYTGFAGFIECFKWLSSHLRSPEDYALITRHLLNKLAAQNVQVAEITIAAGVILWKKQNFADIFAAVEQAAAGSQVGVRWIVDAIRHFGVDHALEVVELASPYVGYGVVAFGIGGDEACGPASWFGPVFSRAKALGFRLTAHAGETCGPESIWAALEIGAERIGHGISAARDPELMRVLRDRDVPLEVCISSNVATGAVASLEAHPVRALYDAGVPIILNSDDPAMFHTTLVHEYELARDVFGFSERELAAMAQAGFRYSFRGPGVPAT